MPATLLSDNSFLEVSCFSPRWHSVLSYHHLLISLANSPLSVSDSTAWLIPSLLVFQKRRVIIARWNIYRDVYLTTLKLEVMINQCKNLKLPNSCLKVVLKCAKKKKERLQTYFKDYTAERNEKAKREKGLRSKQNL